MVVVFFGGGVCTLLAGTFVLKINENSGNTYEV